MKRAIREILDESRWTIKYGPENTNKYVSIYAYGFGANGREYIFSQTCNYKFVHTIEHINDKIDIVGMPFVMSEHTSIDNAVKSFNGFVDILQGYMGLETISEVYLKSGDVKIYTEDGYLVV